MKPRTCVTPSGKFIYGIHQPKYRVENLRQNEYVSSLGSFVDGRSYTNHINFPEGVVDETNADWIFEIPNAFPFRGTTYIAKKWADDNATNANSIALPQPPPMSFRDAIRKWDGDIAPDPKKLKQVFRILPEATLLALAANSTDADDLIPMAEICCKFVYNPLDKRPIGLVYNEDSQGREKPFIEKPALFEVLANNINLPDDYKEAMVLKPGVQGASEIVGEWLEKEKECHVFEYLRRNSYIPWGHFAANMANDAVRYRIDDLTMNDMNGLRHLYYQRTYVRMANQFGIPRPVGKRSLSVRELEDTRCRILDAYVSGVKQAVPSFNRTLWGWNFGFDYAPSHYRLHASHQQIHQQFALVPDTVPIGNRATGDSQLDDTIPAYGSGDPIGAFTSEYKKETGRDFFDSYIEAIRTNCRMDENPDKENSLVVYENSEAMVFVPKAQTSQWELQIMTLKPVGNVLETDTSARDSLDRAMLAAVKILSVLGARMITSIEYSKRFDSSDTDQRLLYSFLPKLPESPGAFSEAQLRWINGHYPEDFASACRGILIKQTPASFRQER